MRHLMPEALQMNECNLLYSWTNTFLLGQQSAMIFCARRTTHAQTPIKCVEPLQTEQHLHVYHGRLSVLQNVRRPGTPAQLLDHL
jgi:hypothetical protein